ncbi:MAG: hypothetical protein NC132_03025 [Corallococcus sp.]|nr:hypothetical protein [Corallococcus sp.]MCM1359082.1 hypothetical protein [Corallococcus sp.]MCM1395071.1 hypothetical protein [Corallococcus sp.]
MLKENEKRTFWIVVMAVATVSLVAAWASAFIVSVDSMIDRVEYIGKYESEAFAFSAAVLLLTVFIAVAAAVTHLATKGRNCTKAKIIWASVIGGFVLLSSIALTVANYCVDELIGSSTSYQALIGYITNTLSIAVSYEIAFLAQMMLTRRPKQETAQEEVKAETENAADEKQK